MAAHPLDRPVRSALATGWAPLAIGGAAASRLDPRYGPFAAAADGTPDSLAALAALVGPGKTVWSIEAAPLPPPPGLVVARTAPLAQMVAAHPPAGTDAAVVDLGEDDAAAMRALAALTRPGPFAECTHRFGGFVGVRARGRLVAMAGERMRMPGHAEVSGVCTHPDHRGRGHAGRLMRTVMRRIAARGDAAFLHAYADNRGAMALYATLGFAVRATLTLTVLGRA